MFAWAWTSRTASDFHREQHEQHKRAFWMLRERRAGKVMLSASSLLKKRVPRTVGGEDACVRGDGQSGLGLLV